MSTRAQRRAEGRQRAKGPRPRRTITALFVGDAASETRAAEIVKDLEGMLLEPGISAKFRAEVERDLVNARVAQVLIVAHDPARPGVGKTH